MNKNTSEPLPKLRIRVVKMPTMGELLDEYYREKGRVYPTSHGRPRYNSDSTRRRGGKRGAS